MRTEQMTEILGYEIAENANNINDLAQTGGGHCLNFSRGFSGSVYYRFRACAGKFLPRFFYHHNRKEKR